MSSEGAAPVEPLSQRQRRIDSILNKTILDIAIYSALGWTAGIFAGLFFKKGRPVRHVWSGIGGSYGFVLNRVNLREFA